MIQTLRRACCRRLSTAARFDAIDRHEGWRASNWGANVRWGGGAHKLAEPTSLPEMQELVSAAARVRCIGSAHSFTPLIGTAEDEPTQLLSLRQMPRVLDLDIEEKTITVDAGTTYSEVCHFLASHPESDLALPNTCSLPHFSVAGAVATGSHGCK